MTTTVFTNTDTVTGENIGGSRVKRCPLTCDASQLFSYKSRRLGDQPTVPFLPQDPSPSLFNHSSNCGSVFAVASSDAGDSPATIHSPVILVVPDRLLHFLHGASVISALRFSHWSRACSTLGSVVFFFLSRKHRLICPSVVSVVLLIKVWFF